MFEEHITPETVRENARDIQSQSNMKYTEALSQARKELHMRDCANNLNKMQQELCDLLTKLNYVNFGENLIPWSYFEEDRANDYITTWIDDENTGEIPFDLHLTSGKIVNGVVLGSNGGVLANVSGIHGDMIYSGTYESFEVGRLGGISDCNTVILGFGSITSYVNWEPFKCYILDVSQHVGVEAKRDAIIQFMNVTVQAKIKTYAAEVWAKLSEKTAK